MKVLIYSSAHCPFCDQAKELLRNKKIKYHEIRVDESDDERKIMMERSQRRTVPQIFIGDLHIGGYTDLYAFDQEGRLDMLLDKLERTG